MISRSLVRELETVVGRGNVLVSPEDLVCYSYDATPTHIYLPDIVALPASTGEVARVVALAAESGLKVTPRGAGTSLSGGSVPARGGLVLPLTRMNRILEIDTENLTATVEPGVVTAILHHAVEEQGLFYPPDPASMNACTIGGNVAECAGGLRARKYGVTRDYLMGLEVVLSSGEVTRIGGKCIKNVAGYNLAGLLAGSEGTLGIFTQAILKLVPKPPAKQTLLALYPNLHSAAASVSAIIAAHIIPTTLEFLDRTTIRCVEAHSHPGLPEEVEAVLLIEVDGVPAAVREEAERVAQVCRREGASEVRMARSAAEAEALTLARRSALGALARVRPTTILEDATVPPSRLPELVSEIARISEKHQVQVGTFGHAGDGNLHPTFLTDERDTDEMGRVRAAIAEVFEATLKLGGTITGEHGVGISKVRFLPLQMDAPSLQAMRLIKQALDPQQLFNPGKIFLESPLD